MLIVGGGLAGAILAAESHSRGVDFKWIISRHIPSASYAAYGMCNPVHFRNKVPAWKSDEFFELSKSFFMNWQEKLGRSFYTEMPIYHLVVDQEELIQWRQNVEITTLWKYTTGDPDPSILPQVGPGYINGIKVHPAFFVSIPEFVDGVRDFFKEKIEWTDLNSKDLIQTAKSWEHTTQSFHPIIFTDGFHGAQNFFFQKVPFNPCKGEILIVKIPDLHLKVAIHKKVVLLPLGNEIFICGATYEWDDLSFNTSDKGRMELEKDLRDIIGNGRPYEILDQKAGVRPAISDRRPVVGWHPGYKGIGILNGFGSRGLMVGPAAAADLLNNIQLGTAIMPDWDVSRFKKRLLKTHP